MLLQDFPRSLYSFLYPHCSPCFSKVVAASLQQGLVLSSGKELQGIWYGYCCAEGFTGWASSFWNCAPVELGKVQTLLVTRQLICHWLFVGTRYASPLYFNLGQTRFRCILSKRALENLCGLYDDKLTACCGGLPRWWELWQLGLDRHMCYLHSVSCYSCVRVGALSVWFCIRKVLVSKLCL